MDYRSLANLGTDLTTFQANQLQGLNQQISVGAGSPEIVTLRRDVWETIPKQHFEEMRRLSKLTGVEPSIHAPMVDTVGIAQGFYSEEARKAEERIIEDVIEKAHLMAPHRNVIVNVHSEAIGKGTIWRKNLAEKLKEREDVLDSISVDLFRKHYRELTPAEKEELNKELQKEVTFGVDKETGQLVPLKFEIKYYPPTAEELEKGYKYREEVWTPARRVKNLNETQWMGEVEALHQHEFRLREVEDRLRRGEGTVGLKGYQETLITHAKSEILDLFNKLQKHIPEEKKNAFEKEKDEFLKKLEPILKAEEKAIERARIADLMGAESEKRLALGLRNELVRQEIENWSDFFAQTVKEFTPERIVPLEKFEIEQAAKTFAEAAEHSLFDVAKGKLNEAPIICIENPPAQQFGLSRADELAKLVEKAREKAIERFKKHGLSEAQAKRAAEKLIGATWDVGHINMLRQGGYTEEDIKKETEKIAKHVKHLHLTDNFGSADSHLPPGYGNVPLKDIQKILGKAGFKGKSVIEAGGFISHFKTSPWPYVLDSMDSPIYEFDAAPTWGPTIYKYEWGSASYPVGYGNIFPSQHFSMYGAGFLLPPTFGALTPGERKKSEFTGTPMA